MYFIFSKISVTRNIARIDTTWHKEALIIIELKMQTEKQKE